MGQGRRRRPPGQHGLQAPRRTDDGEQVQMFDAFLSLTHHLVEQYQGGAAGGSNSEEDSENEAGVPSGPNCMKKLMLVNEIVYEEKVKVGATKPVPNKRASVTLISISVSPQLQEELLRHFRDHLRARGGE